jgi:hypothetical protein
MLSIVHCVLHLLSNGSRTKRGSEQRPDEPIIGEVTLGGTRHRFLRTEGGGSPYESAEAG